MDFLACSSSSSEEQLLVIHYQGWMPLGLMLAAELEAVAASDHGDHHLCYFRRTMLKKRRPSFMKQP
jgi:hypothetical protein